jgi:hypothetical protein
LPFGLGWTQVQAFLGPQGLKIIEEKSHLYFDISKWLNFRVFSDKDVKCLKTEFWRLKTNRVLAFENQVLPFEKGVLAFVK